MQMLILQIGLNHDLHFVFMIIMFYFKDPNKYLAVLPYEDVYHLFDMLNKFVRPENIPNNVKKHMTTTKR